MNDQILEKANILSERIKEVRDNVKKLDMILLSIKRRESEKEPNDKLTSETLLTIGYTAMGNIEVPKKISLEIIKMISKEYQEELTLLIREFRNI